MSTTIQNFMSKLMDDWFGVFVYRSIEDLAARDCQYSEKHDLTRSELHGKRLEKLIPPAPVSINSLVKDTQVVDRLNNEILPELRKLDIQSAKARVLQQIDSMPSSKVRERVPDVIPYIYLQKARGCAIDPGDEAFLQLNAAEQEALVRDTVKQLVDVGFSQLQRYFLATLNRIRKGKVSFETCPFVEEVSRFLPWRASLDLVPLANTPSVTSRFLCLENKAVVEDREAIRDWGGDSDKAFQFLNTALKVRLEVELKVKRLYIPGARYEGIDAWEEPLNDEPSD